jgi:site-specific DNA-methyltransferase (adenine-specific)
MAAATAAAPLSPKTSLARSEYARGEGWRLYQGDSLALMAHLPAQSVDLVFADPPYFLSNGGFTCKGGKRAAVHKGAWDASRGADEDHAFTRDWLAACQRVLKPGGTLWVSGTQHVIFSVGVAMQELGMRLLNTVTWFKPNASPNLSCRYFTHSAELLLWAAPAGSEAGGAPTRLPRAPLLAGAAGRDRAVLPRAGEEELSADGAGRVWTLTPPRGEEKALGAHPTQKPLSLLRRIVEATSAEDALVLDPFNGSGTTGVAAVSLGRRYVGLDLDPAYLALSKARLEQLAEQR